MDDTCWQPNCCSQISISFCYVQMTYAILGGMLNPAHSLTVTCKSCLLWSEIYQSLSSLLQRWWFTFSYVFLLVWFTSLFVFALYDQSRVTAFLLYHFLVYVQLDISLQLCFNVHVPSFFLSETPGMDLQCRHLETMLFMILVGRWHTRDPVLSAVCDVMFGGTVCRHCHKSADLTVCDKWRDT